MKKIFVLFLSMAIFAACSKDDDDTAVNETDPIVGTWVLVEINPPSINIDACEESSTITFNPDNTGEGSFYFEQANCEEQESSGNWTNNGNNSYTIAVPFLGNITGTANFTGTDEFTFTSNIGVLTFERQ